MDLDHERLLRVAATLVRAYVARNHVPQTDLPGLIIKTHSSLHGLATKPARDVSKAVSWKKR